jgi:hypothetical protein
MIALAGVIVLLINVRDGDTLNPFNKTSSPTGYVNAHMIINAVSILTIVAAILAGIMGGSQKPLQMSPYMGPTMPGPPMPQYTNTPPAQAWGPSMSAQMTQPMNMQYGPRF